MLQFRSGPLLKPEKLLSAALVLLVLVAQAIAFAPELTTGAYRNNDNVSHFALIRGMADAVEHGDSALDFWSAETSTGLPLARWYQPLAHWLVVAVYFALGKSAGLMTIFLWARYLAMVFLPLSFYLCMRWLDFPPLTAAAAALLAPLIAGPGPGHVGLEIRSWLGFGAYPQEIGANLLLLFVGLGYRAIRGGRHITPAGVLLGLTILAHLIYGWMGALIACLIAILPDREIPRIVRIRRTAILGAVAGLISAFQLLPVITEGYLINRSRVEPAEKFDSFGAGQVLAWLFSGQIMDHDRVPVLSLLSFAGAGMLLWRYRKTRKLARVELFLLVAAAFWTVVWFGRPTWGALLFVIGATRDLHLDRVLGAVQMFLLFLAAIALAAIWRETARRWHYFSAIALSLVLLAPMAVERGAYISTHYGQGEVTAAAVQHEGNTLDQAIAMARKRGGRVFAGLPGTWGSQFTLGRTPVAAFLAYSLTPAISGPYNVTALPSDLIPRFDQWKAYEYKLFNIRTVLAPPVGGWPGFLNRVADFGRYRVLEAPGEGYFGLVDVAATADTSRDNFNELNEPWLRSDWPEKNQYIRLDFKGDAPKELPRVTPGYFPPIPAAAAAGTVRNERQTGQIYEADLLVQRPAFALFRMTFHPKWSVLIDGKPASTFMVSPGYLATPVGAGTHHISCRYEPGNTKSILGFGGLGLALLLVAIEYGWLRRVTLATKLP